MPHIGLSEAAELTGKDRATIHRAMVSGRLSYAIGPDGARQIDLAKLERVFPLKKPAAIAPCSRRITGRNSLQQLQTDALLEAERNKVAILEATVADLRNRLDRADGERRRVQDQLGEALQQVRLLTDQRPAAPAPTRRAWWRWQRRAT